MKLPLAVVSALAFAGCLPMTPQGYCNQVATLACEKTYDCATEPVQQDALKRMWADKDACIAQQKARMQCDSFTVERACGANKTWNGAKAAACVSDYQALPCDAFSAGTPQSMPNCTNPCE